MTQQHLSPDVFKAYDIRGVVPSQLNADFAFVLGRALARQAKQQHIDHAVVGYDGRHSSPDLASMLMLGMRYEGVSTLSIGMVPTPVVYFKAATYGIGLAVAITGSHNPSDYNGFKMMLGGKALYGEQIQQLHQVMAQLLANDSGAMVDTSVTRASDLPADATLAAQSEYNVLPDYVAHIAADIRLKRPMHIAIDCGNGVGGVVAAELFRRLGCQVDTLYCEVDGDFPNHHPDPADPKNLQDLITHLQHSDAELGLAFDGDADRLGVVTKQGEIIWPDRQLILFAQDVLTRCPGATIIFDVKCTRHVALEVAKAGGEPLMWQTGHSLIKAKMADINAPLAGEMSGHIFFKERWFGFDDGLYAGARLLEILSAEADPNQRLHDLPKDISTPELKLAMAEGEPHAVIARLQQEAEFPTAQSINQIDGVRAEYADGFGLARASNTTPVLVLRFEAQNETALGRIQAEFRAALMAQLPDLRPEDLPF